MNAALHDRSDLLEAFERRGADPAVLGDPEGLAGGLAVVIHDPSEPWYVLSGLQVPPLLPAICTQRLLLLCLWMGVHMSPSERLPPVGVLCAPPGQSWSHVGSSAPFALHHATISS